LVAEQAEVAARESVLAEAGGDATDATVVASVASTDDVIVATTDPLPYTDVVTPTPAPAFASSWQDDVAAEETERPYRRRRNPAKLWMAAAVAFFLLVSAAGTAIMLLGVPNWAVNMGLVADSGEPDLLFYLAKPAERRKLPTGEEYFAFSARIVNSGDHKLSVPPVVVELRDAQDRLVFSWTTKADKASLKPGEEAAINESRVDIPKNAANLSLAFVDRGV
jgi:hypothetical protein